MGALRPLQAVGPSRWGQVRSQPSAQPSSVSLLPGGLSCPFLTAAFHQSSCSALDPLLVEEELDHPPPYQYCSLLSLRHFELRARFLIEVLWAAVVSAK